MARTWSRALLALVAVAILSLGPSPEAVAQTTPSPSPSPSPTASPSPGQSTHAEQDQFRNYVSMVTVDGAGLTAALSGLRSCNQGRAECRRALGAASDQVTTFQSDLDRTPPPACLADTDAELRAALGFYDRGLAMVEEGADAKDRLKVAQGGLLLAVGTWKMGVAIRTARRSECDSRS